MQLLFTLDEIKLLIEVLEQRSDGGHADERDIIDDALDELISRHPQFAADQLDQLAAIITDVDRELRDRLAAATDPAVKAALQNRRHALARIRDKIQEACAMA